MRRTGITGPRFCTCIEEVVDVERGKIWFELGREVGEEEETAIVAGESKLEVEDEEGSRMQLRCGS